MIHIHGFPSGKDTTCAGPAQETDRDNIIDLTETEPVSGTTLIPFNGRPSALNIGGPGYPKANTAGVFTYHRKIPLKRLDTALKKQFGIDSLQLEKRVIYVHGVPASTRLPSSVKSLPGVPAVITLPVACGPIQPAG